MQPTLDKPKLADVLAAEGIEVLQRGGRAWCRCPVHGEKTPSFLIDGTRGHCFGCGFSGDAVDVVMQSHNLDFAGALSYLGLRRDDSGAAKRKRAEARRKREAVERFRTWCNRRFFELSHLIRELDRMKRQAKRGEVCEKLAALYHEETNWLHEQEILDHGTDEEKLQLYRKALHGPCG